MVVEPGEWCLSSVLWSWLFPARASTSGSDGHRDGRSKPREVGRWGDRGVERNIVYGSSAEVLGAMFCALCVKCST